MDEFAWSIFEPTEDEYRLVWLDQAIELLAEYDHIVFTKVELQSDESKQEPPWKQ